MPTEDRANIHAVTFGTGYSVFKSSILPAMETAQEEVILVTCFWADSQTKDALNETLLKLSSRGLQKGRKIKVRIGFSSCSLFQKLFHTSSPSGRTYSPAEWSKTLGLPGPDDLTGLDFQIKSIFFLPFSVWHPKFVIIDRKRVFLPSCNVSWEDWFEGCVELSGPVVRSFLTFWREQWASEAEREPRDTEHTDTLQSSDVSGIDDEVPTGEGIIQINNVPCEFLPSWHHRNPAFRLPWQQYAPAPDTPLNSRLLELFANARKEIYIQTPNVTSPPVIDAWKSAMRRGVSLKIVTSERLMILEQMVTAGTTTARCVKQLINDHQQLLRRQPDEEAGLIKPGRLHISYYFPLAVSKSAVSGGAEPVQSHLKLTIVDNHAVVFGSGNMDRASWYTSQELGVAFFSDGLTAKTRKELESKLEGRLKLVYDSG